jgi:hypothetical protein
MEQINYYDRVGVSNSYLSHFENILLKRNKGKKFREFSFSNFVGSQVHLAMETEGESLANITVSDTFTAKLSGKEPLVWEKIMAGMEIEPAVRDIYTNDISKRIAYFKALYEEYLEEQTNTSEKINISTEKLKWGYLDSEKCDDSYTLFIIQEAYTKLSQLLADIKLSYQPIEEYREDEIYWTDETTGLLCKAKPDYWVRCCGDIYTLDNREILTWLFDFKIGSGEIYTKIRDRRYLRQLSYYAEAINQKYGYIVDKFTILYFNISTLEVEVIDITIDDIKNAQYGGYYTPEFFNQADNMYCDISQLEMLKYNEIWKTPNPAYYIQGWRELLSALALHIEGTQFIEPSELFNTPRLKHITEEDFTFPF